MSESNSSEDLFTCLQSFDGLNQQMLPDRPDVGCTHALGENTSLCPHHSRQPRAHVQVTRQPPVSHERSTVTTSAPKSFTLLAASGSRTPASSSGTPASASAVPASSSSLPASVFRPPASASRPPASASRPPASASRPPAPVSRPPAPVSRPPAPVSRPPASASRPPAPASRASLSASFMHAAASSLPPSASSRPMSAQVGSCASSRTLQFHRLPNNIAPAQLAPSRAELQPPSHTLHGPSSCPTNSQLANDAIARSAQASSSQQVLSPSVPHPSSPNPRFAAPLFPYRASTADGPSPLNHVTTPPSAHHGNQHTRFIHMSPFLTMPQGTQATDDSRSSLERNEDVPGTGARAVSNPPFAATARRAGVRGRGARRRGATTAAAREIILLKDGGCKQLRRKPS